MHIWLIVTLAGSAGGALTTFVPSGNDFPWPEPLQNLVDHRKSLGLFLSLLRNMVFGGVASFVVWALANPTQDFTETAYTVGQVASGIILGGAGGTIVTTLFRRAGEAYAESKTIENLEEIVKLDTEE